ncbi:MarR family transcriptional regulator [Streptomyces cinereoruber]|uniref:MarR family transcriptional regulator n=1 Tax=Streptomyces cinereoruber TaxID=67260 RepID=UPI0036AAD55A
MNIATAHTEGDRGALATAICLCVCAAGLFAEDLLQHGLRRDQRVLAYVAAHPKSSLVQTARDLRLPARVTQASFDRLVAEDLLAEVEEGVAVRAYSLSGKPSPRR